MRSHLLSLGITLSLLAGLAACGWGQSARPAWLAAPDGPSSLDVLKERAGTLHLELACWGPNWGWFGFQGKGADDGAGTRTATCAAKAGGKDVSLKITSKAAGANAVAVEYAFSAPQGAAFTGIALTPLPSREYFAGGKLVATFADGTQKECPPQPARGALNGTVKRLSFRTAGGEEMLLDINPPRAVVSDNGARVWLVGEKLAAGETMATTVTVTAPAAMRFLAADADLTEQHITPEWFPYPVGSAAVPVDLSFLNKDAKGNWIPAGAHGFLKVKGDSFVFEDGTPARFWGTNVTAYGALCPPERAVQIAERLARLGVNLVRLHHLDSSWGPCILDKENPDGTSQNLDLADMRRLDRLVSELKQRGIYVVMDPWVGREYRAGDGIPGWDKMGGGNFGLHPYIFFDPKMQELHRQFLKRFWTHVNEYTGLPYKDDPAIALTEIVNEALFDNGKIGRLEPYRSEFLRLYKEWAAKNGADPNSDVIGQNWPKDHQRFTIHVLESFYRGIGDYDRKELGLKIPMNGTNWFHFPWEIVASAGEEFLDAHHYYGGDRVGPGSGMGGLWVMQKPQSLGTPWGKIGALGILGKPLTVSECGNNPPKTYRAAYYPGLAAVACLQGWDAIEPFAFTQAPGPRGTLSDFEMESDPASVASLAAGALIYRRGDVQPGKQLAVMALSEEEQYAMHWENDGEKAFENTGGFNAALETHRVGVVLGDKAPAGTNPVQVMTPASSFADQPASTELRSDTGELWRDWRVGVGTLDTPRTQAAYGKLGESAKPWATKECVFSITTPYAVVVLSSLTEQPIASSGRLLLTTVARAENTGQSYNLAMTRLVSGGKAPVLAEPVAGTISFRTDAARATAYPIRVDGTRGPAIPLAIQGGRAALALKAEYQTLFYQIETN